jgi:hypothetical protein
MAKVWNRAWNFATQRAGKQIAVLAVGLGLLVLPACSNPEIDAVRTYKGFLEKARTPLEDMNKVREDLYKSENTDEILAKFKDKLLPALQALTISAEQQDPPEAPKLAEFHGTLKQTLQTYTKATERLVKDLQKKDDDARERAISEWGEDDRKFGEQMDKLKDELSAYLDGLKK